MPIENDTFYRTRQTVLMEMLTELQSAIPDAYTGEDGIFSIFFDIQSGQFENLFLANQLLLEDMFIHTASQTALRQHGLQNGIEMKDGTRSEGTVRFEGADGVYIPLQTEIGYYPGGDLDLVYFETTQDGTIPTTGTPTPPTVTLDPQSGNLNGLYEYVVTFVTVDGETLPSEESSSAIPALQRIDLSNIPIGGVAVTGRRIYRQKDGAGDFRLVTTIANNTVTVYEDNVLEASLGATAPSVDTAHRVSLTAQSVETGAEANVAVGAITELTNAPSGLTGVTNTTTFTGGSDPESTEEYRQRILQRIQNPQTGSAGDLKSWAEEVNGIEVATVFPNDNLGVATPGHVTVRIAGPSGAIPSADKVAEVQATLEEQDIQNIAIHVATFTQVSTSVTVTITLESGYSLLEVTPSVQTAITDYINNLQVGQALRVNEIIAAVIDLPGVLDLVVNVPASNLTTATTEKRIPGTITVN